MRMRKKSKKIEDIEILEVVIKDEDVGDVLNIVADENNPVSDGKEFLENGLNE